VIAGSNRKFGCGCYCCMMEFVAGISVIAGSN
jgi:hypothetical protein